MDLATPGAPPETVCPAPPSRMLPIPGSWAGTPRAPGRAAPRLSPWGHTTSSGRRRFWRSLRPFRRHNSRNALSLLLSSVSRCTSSRPGTLASAGSTPSRGSFEPLDSGRAPGVSARKSSEASPTRLGTDQHRRATIPRLRGSRGAARTPILPFGPRLLGHLRAPIGSKTNRGNSRSPRASHRPGASGHDESLALTGLHS